MGLFKNRCSAFLDQFNVIKRKESKLSVTYIHAYTPLEQRHAESPACCRVGVTKGTGVFREGIVVDDRGLVVIETLTQKPFLSVAKKGNRAE